MPETQLTLAFGPGEYLEWTGTDPTICYLKLDPSDVNASPSVRLLGMGFQSERESLQSVKLVNQFHFFKLTFRNS